MRSDRITETIVRRPQRVHDLYVAAGYLHVVMSLYTFCLSNHAQYKTE